MVGVNHVGLKRRPRSLLVASVKGGKCLLFIVDINHKPQDCAESGRERCLVVIVASDIWGPPCAIDRLLVSEKLPQWCLAQRLVLIFNDMELAVLPLVHVRTKTLLELIKCIEERESAKIMTIIVNAFLHKVAVYTVLILRIFLMSPRCDSSINKVL